MDLENFKVRRNTGIPILAVGFCYKLRQIEIAQLRTEVVIEKDVLGLDVAVCNSAAVKVTDRFDDSAWNCALFEIVLEGVSIDVVSDIMMSCWNPHALCFLSSITKCILRKTGHKKKASLFSLWISRSWCQKLSFVISSVGLL